MAAMRKFEVTSNCCNQAHIQGGAIGCTAPTINLAARTRNLQNIKDKHADQPAKKKKRATPCHIHVLPPLNRRLWKKLKHVHVRNFILTFLTKRARHLHI